MTDYAKLVDTQLLKAFKRLNSLLVTAVFHLKSNETFNFVTGKKEADSKDKTVRVFVINTSQKKDHAIKTILMERIEELDLYDSVTVGESDWRLGAVTQDNAHTQIIEVISGKV